MASNLHRSVWSSRLVLGYFSLGYFTYKYHPPYAMDQLQHATGGAWHIICYRIVLGLVVFHLSS
ncbi:uncharacterized protein B0H64DRAFT_446705 [Chaetomium fimeti]|uniref:CSC1/OSCA1-like 7TM region domain-containing protein n=1 Tax=Chaetomium fimeti TaxID=1854472 RepID=A0AAE0H6H7_9PEZI|nr:hypothetical protein B0H64DRAFT_446705 [Chaetomium fimeti]